MRINGLDCFSQQHLEDALAVIRESRVDEPALGAKKPFYAPGGEYGKCWWSLDYSQSAEAVKWYDFKEALSLIDTLYDTQKPDGRVLLYGFDAFGHIPNVQEPVSSLPKYFETCCRLAVMSGSSRILNRVLQLFIGSLNWWEKNRLDRDNGLFTAVFEETFIPNTVSSSGVYAPVDTNAMLLTGMKNTAYLLRLGGMDGAEEWEKKAERLRQNIARLLWNPEKQAFYPYVIPRRTQYPALMASAFMGYTCCSEEQAQMLDALLKNDARFGWETAPVNSVAKDDPLFTVVTGAYAGNLSWSGSIWALINDEVVRALRAVGRDRLADELSHKTLRAYAGNYGEFLHPFTLKPQGAPRYSWSAALCIRLLIEEVFGLSYNGFTDRVEVRTKSDFFAGQDLRLEGLKLPDGKTIDVVMQNGEVTVRSE